jgi:hypothetical protein
MNKFHGPVTPSTNGFFDCLCPVCGKRKFAFNPTYLTGRCWRGCFNGFLIDVIKLYHGISYFEAHELVDSMPESAFHIPAAVNRAAKNARISLPRGFHSILDGNGILAQRARDYLEGRGFDLNYLDRIGVGYVDIEMVNPLENYFGRIIIPLKRDGILSYFIGRTFIDDYLRYKNPAKSLCGVGKSDLFFNEEAFFIEPKVYVTEGWACAASIQRKGASQQGSSPSLIQRNIIVKSPVQEVVLIPDAFFYVQGLQAARQLIQHKKVKVINLDEFEAQGLGKDVAEIGVENLYALEARTPWMDPVFLYKQLKIYG